LILSSSSGGLVVPGLVSWALRLLGTRDVRRKIVLQNGGTVVLDSIDEPDRAWDVILRGHGNSEVLGAAFGDEGLSALALRTLEDVKGPGGEGHGLLQKIRLDSLVSLPVLELADIPLELATWGDLRFKLGSDLVIWRDLHRRRFHGGSDEKAGFSSERSGEIVARRKGWRLHGRRKADRMDDLTRKGVQVVRGRKDGNEDSVEETEREVRWTQQCHSTRAAVETGYLDDAWWHGNPRLVALRKRWEGERRSRKS
jgi:hypothetical protein